MRPLHGMFLRVFWFLLTRIRKPVDHIRRRHISSRKLTDIVVAAKNAFDAKPIYRTFNTTSYVLSVAAQYVDIKPILASYYINLHANRGPAGPPLARISPVIVPERFAAIGHFDCEVHTQSIANQPPLELRKWIATSIHEGWYIRTHINEYYVPGSRYYNIADRGHVCLILGCDTRNDSATVCRYTKARAYQVSDVPLASLIMAIKYNKQPKVFYLRSAQWGEMIERFRPRADARALFSAGDSILSIKGYLQSSLDGGIYQPWKVSRIPECIWREIRGNSIGRVFGITAMRRCLSYIESRSSSLKPIDLRVSRLLWEHKKIIYSNLCYLYSLLDASHHKNSLRNSADYKRVTAWALLLHLSCVGFNRDMSKLAGVRKILGESSRMIEIECMALKSLPNELMEKFSVKMSN